MEFKANIVIKGKIECLTGLHIGGSKDKIEIGGLDSPVIRNLQNQCPYIPGSSLKGKLRHLLEFGTGAVVNPSGDLGTVSKSVNIVRLFGIGADLKDKNNKDKFESALEKVGPSRLIIRDAMPDSKTIQMWREVDSDYLYTEVKAENTIDRLTSAANPRFIERVIPGSKFDIEIIYSVYDLGGSFEKDVKEDLDNLKMALRLLESTALGKSGSRGYGQIKFEFAKPIIVYTSDYRGKGEAYKAANRPAKDLTSLEDFDLTYAEKA